MAKNLLWTKEETDVAMEKQKNKHIKEWISHHLIEEILLKLPPKSLLRFNCLSSSWKATISSSFFSRAYLQKNKTNPPLIVFLNREFMSDLGLDDEAGLIDIHTLVENLKIQPQFTGCKINIGFESGCDGILCIRNIKKTYPQNVLVLWNPSIKKHKILTLPKIKECGEERFGIGYDPSTGDYKIVKFSRTWNNSKKDFYSKVEVFTLKSNKWRPLSYDLPYLIDIRKRPVSVKGAMYWLAELEENKAILCFNLANETFSTVELPPTERIFGLMEHEGKLGCFCSIRNSLVYDGYDVWVMEEDQTWVRLTTTTYDETWVHSSHFFEPTIYCAASLVSFE